MSDYSEGYTKGLEDSVKLRAQIVTLLAESAETNDFGPAGAAWCDGERHGRADAFEAADKAVGNAKAVCPMCVIKCQAAIGFEAQEHGHA